MSARKGFSAGCTIWQSMKLLGLLSAHTHTLSWAICTQGRRAVSRSVTQCAERELTQKVNHDRVSDAHLDRVRLDACQGAHAGCQVGPQVEELWNVKSDVVNALHS